MSTVIFEATVGEEQVIRPPANLRIPPGELEVTVRPVAIAKAATSATDANKAVRASRVSLGRAIGIDNEAIDADLARQYEEATP